MTGYVTVEEGSIGFASLMAASSRSGGWFVERVKMLRALSARFRVARSEAAFSSRSLRFFSMDAMCSFLLVILVCSALSGALEGSRTRPRSHASAASGSLSSARQAVLDR